MKGKKKFSLENIQIEKLVISRANTNVSTELDDETVILDIASGVYIGLDPIGTVIWNILNHPQTFASLRDKILNDYDVSKEQCVKDISVFLQELFENDLIVVGDEPIL